MSKLDLTDKERLLVEIGANPYFAHELLFAHRHPDETPSFHFEIIRDLHSDTERFLFLAFRGAAKSTRAEEYICLGACLRRFRNFIIIGESATRACERLAAIKHEIDFNEHINFLFGNLHGEVWNEDKVVLTNGVVVQAFGRGQSLRGTKHDDVRPDACLIDDLEDEESVATPEGRDKVQRWVMRTLLPALAPGACVRMLANLLDPDCLAARLRKTGVWEVREYPWEYISSTGERIASWPARFPLDHIDRVRAEYVKSGMLNEYMQEFMVSAMDPSARTFTTAMLAAATPGPSTPGRVRTWEPVYAAYDPARTVKASSAHTGKVVFSWVGSKLIVWEADGQLWLPDQIISDIFQVAEAYQPIRIGVEKDGLEEFLLQPLRAESTRRHTIIPVVPLSAPAGKLAFIRSLQPFFTSGEIVFAKDLPVLREQLLSFPTGRIDVPNALAYALRMRPGVPVYDNFGFKNVQDDLPGLRAAPYYLVVGATRTCTSVVLCQMDKGVLRVLWDAVRDSDPGLALADVVGISRLETAGQTLTVYAGPEHWRPYDTIGLQAAARRAQVRLSTGGSVTVGREELRRRIDAMSHNQPALVVSPRARWTLNALAGGYARSVIKGRDIVATDQGADEGVYRVLMEALESFAAVIAQTVHQDGLDKPNYAIDPTGRRYLSARAQHPRPGGARGEPGGSELKFTGG